MSTFEVHQRAMKRSGIALTAILIFWAGFAFLGALDPVTSLVFLAFSGMGLFGIYYHGAASKRAVSGGKVVGDILDDVLCTFGPKDGYTVRDHCANTLVVGRAGAGKTTGAGDWVMRGLVAHPRSGGLILAAKPGEDLSRATRIFAEYGRSNDLIVMNAEGNVRFNILDWLHRSGMDATGITQFLSQLSEIASGPRTNIGEQAIWQQYAERHIYNAVVVVRLAEGRVSAPLLHSFITNAARHPSQTKDDKWRNGPHNTILRKAYENVRTQQDKSDLDLASVYWTRELPSMADKTRSGVEIGVMGLLHILNTGLCRTLFSQDTNFTPEHLWSGKWLFVDLASATYGQTGKIASCAVKLAVEMAILRHVRKPGDAFITIFSDEAQQFIIPGHDPLFLSSCRSHGGSMVALTQSLHNIRSALGGNNEHDAESMISQFQTKIVHALGSSQDAEYFAKLIGQERDFFLSGNSSGDNFAMFTHTENHSYGYSEQKDWRIQPDAFMNGLRCGGTANNGMVDAIAIRSGEPFSHGQNFTFVSFKQR